VFAQPSRSLTRLVPLVVLGASLLLVTLVESSQGRLGMFAILLAIGAVAGILILACQPELGVAIVPLVASAVPLAIGTGTESRLPAGLLLSALMMGLWLLRALVGQQLVLVSSVVNAPVLALSLVWIVSYAYSSVSRPPLVTIWPTFPLVQLGALAIVLISAGSFILALNTARDLRWVQIATWSFLGLGAVLAGAAIVKKDHWLWFVSTGGLFTTWVVVLAYGQALFNGRLAPWIRLGLLALVAAWLYRAVVLQTQWLSGWIPPLAGIACITLLRSRRLFVLLVLVAAIGAAVNFDRVYHAVWDSQVDEGDLGRLEIWLQAWDLLRQNLVLGTGPAGYAAYYMSLYSGSGTSMSTHSNYVDVAAQTGLIGTIVFSWFLGALVIAALRACRHQRAGFAAGYAYGATGGLVAVLVAMGLGDWFIPFVYNQGIAGFRYTVQSWVFLGLLAGLATAPARESEG
jgi:O-antigen ligase